jgi:hypothetical protein
MKSRSYRITSSVREFVSFRHAYFAGALLAIMFGLGMYSMVGNSAIMDEVAHIPAAYSYLHYGDYRLNPEHPPLIKDLAGIPLQFMHLKFPINSPDWTTEMNGEWDVGWDFLYNLGNNADAILFWARLPILLLSIGFGIFFYVYTRKRWGTLAAMLALSFYVFSPSILGASITVTTDLGAAIFIFVGVAGFVRYILRPSRGNMFLMSIGIALAQLAKFNGVVLYPFLLLAAMAAVWLDTDIKDVNQRTKLYVGGYLLACVLSVVWIWLFYVPEVWNMPLSIQRNLITGNLVAPNTMWIGHILVSMSQLVFTKPIVQYLLGVIMVLARVSGGNVTYFNGQVTDMSFHGYFPETFIFKTQVSLLILMFGAMIFGSIQFVRRRRSTRYAAFKTHVREHITEWTFGAFAVFYFTVAVAGNLNLGVRHILPVYLPIFMIVAVVVSRWMHALDFTKWRWASIAGLAVAMVWYVMSTILQAPSYIPYLNELAGGSGNAYKYFTDSSIDWGQDLERLKTYVDQHPQIHHIAIDYFGGGMPEYYFCQREYDAQGHLITGNDSYDCSHSVMEIWHSSYGRYTGQYIAVSETYLENDKYFSGLAGQPGYAYLRAMKPIAKIGYSIYLYKLY